MALILAYINRAVIDLIFSVYQSIIILMHDYRQSVLNFTALNTCKQVIQIKWFCRRSHLPLFSNNSILV